MPSPRNAPALAVLVPLSLAFVLPAGAQGLNGQAVHLTVRAPDKATVIADYGTQTVTPAGTVFADSQPFNLITTLVTPTQITFSNSTNGTEYFFGPFAFNGFVVSEAGPSPAVISSVSIDSATDVAGFTANQVSFDSTDVFADFQNTQFNPGQKIILDLNRSPVPEASTTVSFGLLLVLGLGGWAVVARKKKSAF